MDYTFTKLRGRNVTDWAAQHPNTPVVGFGHTKIAAIRDLEIGKTERTSAVKDLVAALHDSNVPLDGEGNFIFFKSVAV